MTKRKREFEFYCLKGKHNFKSRDWKKVTFKNKRKAVKARCPKHDFISHRIISKDVDREI